jgi:hypothetical protein
MKIAKLARVTPPVREPERDWRPFASWGDSALGPSDDDLDGAHVNGATLRRLPDGTVISILDEPSPKEN